MTTTKAIQTSVQPAIFNAVDREAKVAGLILFAEHRQDGIDYFRFNLTMGTPISPWIAKKSYALMWVAGYIAAKIRQ